LFNDALESRGLFAFAVPDRLRWEITQPFHSLLIMNGHEVAKYDFPDGKNPRKLQFPAANALSEVLQQIADIHQGKFGAESKNYDIKIYQGETARMTLVPKDPRMKKMISQIDIGFSKELDRVASVVIREKGGDFTRIVFEDDPRNPTLPDSLFSIP
jgi:outer membrane lipoprotein-sorting protein